MGDSEGHDSRLDRARLVERLRRARQRFLSTITRVNTTSETSYRLTADAVQFVAEGRRLQAEIQLHTKVLWTTLDRQISCTHTVRAANDHEIAVTVGGTEVWSEAISDSDAVAREAERLRQLFCN